MSVAAAAAGPDETANTDASSHLNSQKPPSQQPGERIVTETVPLEPLSCVACRARKLKCDRLKPACGRCIRVAAECVYPGARRKPKVRRRNVKELEARLAHVEEMLLGRIPSAAKSSDVAVSSAGEAGATEATDVPAQGPDLSSRDLDIGVENLEGDVDGFDVDGFDVDGFDVDGFDVEFEDVGPHDEEWSPYTDGQSTHGFKPPGGGNAFGGHDNAPESLPAISQPGGPTRPDPGFGALVGLGMAETLPPPELIEDLHDEFFQRHHPFIPIVHPGRYLSAFYSPPYMRPPMCLQYIIWALAAYGHEKYDMYHDAFYRRARAYIDKDEMKGVGEHFVTLAHAQALCLLASYQSRLRLYTRSSMDLARGVRLINMMGLHCIDGNQGPMMPTLLPPSTWVEREERRRTFWAAFCGDSHASIATGWPSLIDPNEITTHLPASDEAFLQGREETTCTLHGAIDTRFAGVKYTWFTGLVFICYIHSQLLKHIYRPTPHDNPHDVEHGAYWRRHRSLDRQLDTIFHFLPQKMTIPPNQAPSAFHTAMNLQTAVTILHHSAMSKIEEHKLSDNLRAESRRRLRGAAGAIASIVKVTGHLIKTELSAKAPLMSIALYLGSTAYMSLAMESPSVGFSDTDRDNLVVIIEAMIDNSPFHHVAESFLHQLALDVEHSGLQETLNLPDLSAYKLPPSAQSACHIPLVARNSVTKFRELMTLVQSTLGLTNPPTSKRAPTRAEYKARMDGQAEQKKAAKFKYYSYINDMGHFDKANAPMDMDSSSQKQATPAPAPAPAPVTPAGTDTGFTPIQMTKSPSVPWHQNPNATQIAAVDPFPPGMVTFSNTLPDRTVSSQSSPCSHGEAASGSYTTPSPVRNSAPPQRLRTKWIVGLGGLDVDMSVPSPEYHQIQQQQQQQSPQQQQPSQQQQQQQQNQSQQQQNQSQQQQNQSQQQQNQSQQQQPPELQDPYADWGGMLDVTDIFGPQHTNQQTMAGVVEDTSQGNMSWTWTGGGMAWDGSTGGHDFTTDNERSG